MKRRNHYAAGGFSLMEMLVVIAIIALLAVLLFPAFQRSREMADRARTASNLRQLHTAAMNHVNDRGGRLPFSTSHHWYDYDRDGVFDFTKRKGWVDWNDADFVTYWWDTAEHERGRHSVTNGTLFPYLGDRGDESILVCPRMLRVVRQVGAQPPTPGLRVARSYGMNDRLSNMLYYQIDGPSRTMLFAQQGFVLQSGFSRSLRNINTTLHTDPVPTEPGSRRFARHLDGAIEHASEHIGEYHDGRAFCVFVDGHVEQVPFGRTRDVSEGNWGD